jgi:hypothetical protein
MPRGLRDQLIVWLRQEATMPHYRRDALPPPPLVNDPDAFIECHLDKLCFIINRIVRNQVIRRGRDGEAYVPFDSNLTDNLLGDHTTWFKNFLLRRGVIECDDDFVPQAEDTAGKGKCKGYRLTAAWRWEPREDVLIQSQTLLNALARLELERALARIKGEQYLEQNLHALVIRDDQKAHRENDEMLKAAHPGRSVVEAYAWRKKMRKKDPIIVANTDVQYGSKEKNELHAEQHRIVRERRWQYLVLTTFHRYRVAEQDFYERLATRHPATMAKVDDLYMVDQHEAARCAIKKWVAHKYFYKPDPYGRWHSNLTNAPEWLRKHLIDWRFPGYSIYNLDLRNSQPYFLGLCALEAADDDDSVPSDVRQYLQDCIDPKEGLYERLMDALSARYTREAKNARQAARQEQKPKRADTLRAQADRYEQKARGYSRGVDGTFNPTARWRFKSKFFEYLYGDSIYRSFLKDVFEELYPSMAAYIHEEKRGDFRELARKMQRKESQLVLGKVAPRLHACGYVVNTIHDSFFCALSCPEASLRVQGIIRAVFEEEVGIAPYVKIDLVYRAHSVSKELANGAEAIQGVLHAPQSLAEEKARQARAVAVEQPAVAQELAIQALTSQPEQLPVEKIPEPVPVLRRAVDTPLRGIEQNRPSYGTPGSFYDLDF